MGSVPSNRFWHSPRRPCPSRCCGPWGRLDPQGTYNIERGSAPAPCGATMQTRSLGGARLRSPPDSAKARCCGRRRGRWRRGVEAAGLRARLRRDGGDHFVADHGPSVREAPRRLPFRLRSDLCVVHCTAVNLVATGGGHLLRCGRPWGGRWWLRSSVARKMPKSCSPPVSRAEDFGEFRSCQHMSKRCFGNPNSAKAGEIWLIWRSRNPAVQMSLVIISVSRSKLDPSTADVWR